MFRLLVLYLLNKMRNFFVNIIIGGLLVLTSTNGALALSFPSPEKLFSKPPVVDQIPADSTVTQDEIDAERARRTVALPKGNLITDILPQAVNLFLYAMGIVIFIVLVYAGIRMILSRGDEDEVTKLKDLIIHMLLGAAIVGGAFALVSGVLRVIVNL